MLIAQITDLHIGMGEASRLNDARLEQVVAQVEAARPDVVLATGDLVDGGDAASYTRLKAILAPLSAPLLPCVGNHDERSAFAAAFDAVPTHDGFVQYATRIGGLRIVILDTVEPGRHGGAFCERRADWLADCLDEEPETPTLIALHHPPVKTGIAWLDHGADGPWARRLGDLLADRAQVVAMVCGHIHRPITTTFAGRPLIIAPPSAPLVLLDLGPECGDGNAAMIPRIVEEEPGFALHVWGGDGLISHFAKASDHRVLASLDVATDRIVAVPDAARF